MKSLGYLLIIILMPWHLALGLELKPVGKPVKKPTTNDLLQSQLGLVSYRHKVLAENIANVNTPGYKAREVHMPETVQELAAGGKKTSRRIPLKLTSSKHIAGQNNSNGNYSSHVLENPFEVKKNKNTVSLAQQINKISQNQTAYDTGLKISASTNSLISTILGK